jgi:FkbM family methyltransferase
MIRVNADREELIADGQMGRLMSLDPPLVLNDFKMYYPDSDGFESAILNSVKRAGVWELNETLFLINKMADGGLMLDIGAHLGYFGFIASRASEGKAEVHMFEPSEDMCNSMKETIKYEMFPENIHVHNYALSETSGDDVTLYSPTNDSGSSTMVSGAQQGPQGTLDMSLFKNSFTGKTLRLDDLNLSNVKFIKMDVEGFEHEVWKGMRETINRSPGLIIMMETGAYHSDEFRKEWRETFDEYVFDYDGSLAEAPNRWLDMTAMDTAVLIKR